MTLLKRVQKLITFLKINCLLEVERPFILLARYSSIFLFCLIYTFLSKIIWQKHIQLNGHDINFPLFIITGAAMMRFISFPLNMFHETLLSLKHAGMAAWIHVTSTSMWELFLAKAIWGFFLALTEFVMFIVCSTFLMKIAIGFLNISFLIALAFAFISYSGISMMILGVGLFLRKEASLSALISQISITFGGVFFPVALLPGLLKTLSVFIPMTHVLKIVRSAGISSEIASSETYLILSLITIVTWTIGFVLINSGFVYAKENGYLERQL